jgi:lactate dehydrogenase-like 2-hydroxyacid dehydrogenase
LIFIERNRLPLSDELKLSVQYAPFEDLIATSDYVSLHVPNTKETTGLINAEVLSKMKVLPLATLS